MLRMLRERLAPATVESAEALGWSADAIEAQAFGFLAAGSVIAMIPCVVLFVALQRYYVAGLSADAVKG